MKLVVTDSAISWNDVKWDESVVQVVSLQEARDLNIGIDNAESIDGTSVCLENMCYCCGRLMT